MAHLLKLDEFETAQAPSGPVLMMPEDLETLRLAAYEDGYKAGWDDGCQQRLADADQARERLAGQLEAIGFGYAEAQASLLRSLHPVLVAVVQVFLPVAAQAAVPPLVAETLLKQAALAAGTGLALRLHPDRINDVQAALDGLAVPPFELVADDSLALTEALLDAGSQQVAIDLGAACAQIEDALMSLYQPRTKERRHA